MRKLQHVVRAAGVHEGVVDFLARHHRTQRLHTVGDLLGDVDDVGCDAKGLGPRPGAHAAKAGDDLVKDQQNVVRGADLAQALQVALRRHDDASRAGHRLDDDGGDVGRVMQADDVQQLVSQVGALLGHATHKAAVGGLGVGQVVGLDALTKELAVGHQPAHRDAAEVDAVVALDAADEPGLAGLALVAPVSACHLQRSVGSF